MVEIIRLSVDPITTPDCPDPTPLPRHVRIRDRITTLHLETATWEALGRIAREQECPVDNLCAEIAAACAPDASFAQAARYYVTNYIAAQLPDHLLPHEFREIRSAHSTRRSIN